jgi:hypothetical protein
MRKISTKMAPRILTDDQKKRWLHISSDLLQNAVMFGRSLLVMKRGVFNTTCKQNAIAYSGEQNAPETMLVCFFDHKGILHNEFIAQGQTVNQQCHLEVLRRLRESV